jgi:4-amino-4-deoxy-L-arabinose transferase-like glycosyltransferase
LRSAADRLSLVLAAGYLAAALHGLGGADIVGDDEAREAGVVQEILAGDWLWPRFNGETIPDKPLLFHWLAAVPCAVAGFSEAAVRLPSALAGAALVGWTGRFGTRLLGPPAGVVAAGLLATTPPLFTRARVARPDLLLVLLLSLALGLAFRWWSDRRRADATLALVALGAATLAKGPVAPVLFALTLGGFLAWQGQLRRLPALMTAPGVAAFLVLGLGWYLVALGGWGHLFVAQHLLGRYVFNLLGDVPAGGAYSTRPAGFHLFFYLKHLPAVALPWTPLVALTLWQAWRADGLRDPRVRFLVCWALAPVLAFTPAQ